MKPELWWTTYFTRGVSHVEVDFRWLTLPTRHRVFPALQFLFEGDCGGYFGPQSPGAFVLFSVWDKMRTGETSLPWSFNARRFDNEGNGAQSSIPITWKRKRWYRFRLSRLSLTFSPDQRARYIWRCEITERRWLRRNRWQTIGEIAVPMSAGNIAWLNGWIEYVGGPDGCDQEPVKVEWRDLTGVGTTVARQQIMYSAACPNVSGVVKRRGVMLAVGRGVRHTPEPGVYRGRADGCSSRRRRGTGDSS